MQNHINNLYKFCAAWHLIVSLPTTKVLIFNDSHKAEKFIFNFGKETIDIVSEYKYLGIIFTSNSRNVFEQAVIERQQKATAAMYQMCSDIKNSIGQPPIKLALKTFNAQVLSVLEYGIEIWGNLKQTQCRDTEKFHLKYLKNVLGVRRQTSTAGVYAETGQAPLQAKHEHATIRYWHHVTKLPTTHIVNICYQELRKLEEAGAENWCSYVRRILSAANSYNYWTDQGSLTRSCLPVIKANLERIHITKCMENIANTDPGNKLRTYKQITKEFSLEKYLLVVMNPKHRQALTRLRLSSHQLEIEMGRHTRPPVVQSRPQNLQNVQREENRQRSPLSDGMHLKCTSEGGSFHQS